MGKILLKGGIVVSAEGQEQRDVFIEDGKIVEEMQNCEVIDCTGKYILPGAIDVHVHLREPGHTHKEDLRTGTEAAVAGGITTVFDMPNTNPPTTTQDLVDAKYEAAMAKSVAHVGFYALAVPNTIDEVLRMENIVGIKIYLGASTGGHEEEVGFVEEIFKKAQEIGPIATEKILVVHAENGACIAKNEKAHKGETDPAIHSQIRSAEAASMSTRAVCELAKKYNARVHIAHMSTAEEVEILRSFGSDRITCEVTPHHLFLNTDNYEELGTKMRVNPPVRAHKDAEALWQGINDGVVNMIGTDHAPHTLEEKSKGYWEAPSGMPQLDTMMSLMLNEVNKENLSLTKIVELTSVNPAKVFNLRSKGHIKPGMDADLVVVDMDEERTVENDKLFTKCGWSPFDGWKLKGWPLMTFVSGELMYEKGQIVAKNTASTIF